MLTTIRLALWKYNIQFRVTYVDTRYVDNTPYVDNFLDLLKCNIHCSVTYVDKTPDMLTRFWPFEKATYLLSDLDVNLVPLSATANHSGVFP